MANASNVQSKEIEVVVKTTKTIQIVNLELTVPEAETLLMVVQNIGGAKDTTRRGHMTSIGEALESAGIEEKFEHREGSIYFTEKFDHNA